MVNIPGDDSEWGINSDQFIREKMLGSNAFYSINIYPNGLLTNYILDVRIHVHVIMPTVYTVYT